LNIKLILGLAGYQYLLVATAGAIAGGLGVLIAGNLIP
jgi:hypothetical protein